MDILQQLQLDTAAVLESLPDFVHVPVTVIRPRSKNEAVEIQTVLNKALSGLIKKPLVTGKSGLAVMVLMTEASLMEESLKRAHLMLNVTLTVIENPMINMGANGTQISCEALALSIVRELHQYDMGGGIILRARQNDTLEVVNTPGLLTYNVHFECEHSEMRPTRVKPCSVSAAGNVITLACVTPDAEIFYTLDRSFPSSSAAGNAASLPYEGPFEVEAPVVLRAAAYKVGFSPSPVVLASILQPE